MILDTFKLKRTQFIFTLRKMNTSPNTHTNVVDEATNSHINIGDKEKELLIIALIETLKCQKKVRQRRGFSVGQWLYRGSHNSGKFWKILAILRASHSIKCNIISNLTCLSIPKYSSIPKVSIQRTSSIKSDFEDFKTNFIETLNVETELFIKQQK